LPRTTGGLHSVQFHSIGFVQELFGFTGPVHTAKGTLPKICSSYWY
jgi:hypothetical protein